MALNLGCVGRAQDLGTRSWTSSDAILYALAVGAGSTDPARELEFTTENSLDTEQRVLPTFAAVVAITDTRPDLGDFPLSKVLHVEQELVLHEPIPVAGTAHTTVTVDHFLDKGTDAVVGITGDVVDTGTGRTLAQSRRSLFIRGEGGFGGDRGSTPPWAPPSRTPDWTTVLAPRRDQSLLYRLTGDRNPLHSDPRSAQRSGFTAPILHGMCTYGFVGRELLHAYCDGEPARLRRFACRFTAPVIPGDRLTVDSWHAETGCLFRVRVDDRVVLDRGVLECS